MEGLIPMVYKSLKKNKTRRKYECLSSGAAQAYNIEDFYTKNDVKQEYSNKVSGLSGARHRRHNSIHVDQYVRSFVSGEDAVKRKQLVRFRSQRMFSCVTGGA